VRDFLERANPDALTDIARKLDEAIDRGLWRSRRNDLADQLAPLVAAHSTRKFSPAVERKAPGISKESRAL
ncbi:MAG: hypothetical protein EON96_06720, partial [Caulobacteraceae bacterium]